MQSGRSVVAPYMPPLPDRVRGRDARRPPLPRSHVLVLSDSSLVRLRDPALLLKREPERSTSQVGAIRGLANWVAELGQP